MTRRLLHALLVAVFAALILIGTVRLADAGDYNSNPTYCHSHSDYDLLWWFYECWLPDPPGGPY